MPLDQSSGIIPEANTIINSLVYAVNILDFDYLRNSFKIKSDEHALLSLS